MEKRGEAQGILGYVFIHYL